MQYIDMRVLQVGAKKKLRVADSKTGEVSNLTADVIINAAGLQAQEVVASLAGFPRHKVLRRYLARGCYFTLAGMLHSHATVSQTRAPPSCCALQLHNQNKFLVNA